MAHVHAAQKGAGGLPPTKRKAALGREAVLTSVSIAKSGFHESGGMTLQIPKAFASGVILRMYSIGSFHSSSVGW